MPHASKNMLVAPGTTPLGREVCRLGRAAGHEMTSLAAEGRPSRRAPWLHGVAWSTGDATDPEDLAQVAADQSAVILLPPEDAEQPAVGGEALRQLVESCRQSEVDRVVYATAGHTDADGEASSDEEILLDGGGGQIALRLPAIEEGTDVVERAEPDEPNGDRRCPPVPVGQAAMAVLRAAAEPDRSGLIGCRQATQLGYAVMIQQ